MDARAIAILRGEDWWQGCYDPSDILDQLFGLHLTEDDISKMMNSKGDIEVRRTRRFRGRSGASEIWNRSTQFQVRLVVNKFRLEELEVRLDGRFIVIHGKHEEREEGEGFVSREFTRKYMMPNGCDMETASSNYYTTDEDNCGRVYVIMKKEHALKPKDIVVPIVLETAPPSSDIKSESSSLREGS